MFLSYLCSLLIHWQSSYCKDQGFIIPPLEKSLQVLSSNQSSASHLSSEDIKILVWNIYKSEKKGWLHDYQKLSNANDILLIQEAELNDAFLNSIKLLTNFTFVHATSFIFQKNNHATGTLIGSKYFMSSWDILRSTSKEPIIQTPKTLSIATFPLQHSADDLLVVNIHGLNATKTQSFKEQILSTTTLLKNHVGPIIFAGDFNTRNKKRTQFLKSFMRHYGLREVHWDKDYRMKFANYPLDHVFVKKLHIKKSVVRNDIDTSDHKALEVHLALE